MKVLHVLDWYRPFGGAERLLFGMLEQLETAGHENIVVADDVRGQSPTGRRSEYFLKDLEAGFAAKSPFSILGRSGWIRELRARLLEIIERHRPDVAHIHNMQNPFVIETLTAVLPCVRSIHDPRLYCFTDWKLLPNRDICPYPLGGRCLSEGCIPSNPLALSSVIRQVPYRFLHLRAHRAVDLLLAESQAVRECLLQNGFADERVALLPNMTPLYGSWEEVFRFNEEHREAGGRTVLFVGRASYEKGIDYLLEAMALLPKPWKLILVTGGEYFGKVRAKIRALEISDCVELTGFLSYEDTRACYARADVVVVPSVWIESFGLVGLEAMANGKPVVAFRAGGIPDWLEDGETGYLVGLKRTRELADRIGQLLAQPELARRMGRGGYERVTERFNGELYLRRLLAVYDRAVQRRRKDRVPA